ncbi:MAG: hypothetical protein F6J93_20410 [Oscillatoria sp. SIO1A7]|nr:hypothetical protein [Oscillatoria sp. SIO1A7]
MSCRGDRITPYRGNLVILRIVTPFDSVQCTHDRLLSENKITRLLPETSDRFFSKVK